MKKDGLKTILELALLLIVVFSISSAQSTLVTGAIFALWLGSMLVGIGNSIRYRAGFKKGEIRYATLRDGTDRYAQLAIGVFILLLSVGCYFTIPATQTYALAGSGIAFLIILMGLIGLPGAVLQLKDNKLVFSGMDDKIDGVALKRIEIEQDRITVVDQQERVLTQTSLNLSSNAALLIEQFLRRHVAEHVSVKNSVR